MTQYISMMPGGINALSCIDGISFYVISNWRGAWYRYPIFNIAFHLEPIRPWINITIFRLSIMLICKENGRGAKKRRELYERLRNARYKRDVKS